MRWPLWTTSPPMKVWGHFCEARCSRQIGHEEETSWQLEIKTIFRKAMRWLPTSAQLSDNLTKVIPKTSEWWSRLKRLNPAGSTV